MLRSIHLTLFFLAISLSSASAAVTRDGVSSVPEIDPTSAVAAVALLSGGFMVLRAKRKRL